MRPVCQSPDVGLLNTGLCFRIKQELNTCPRKLKASLCKKKERKLKAIGVPFGPTKETRPYGCVDQKEWNHKKDF